jgi:uncharacterized protein YqhQ
LCYPKAVFLNFLEVSMPSKYTDIGGQAVLEGVMMRSPADEKMAIAVRRESGQIVVESEPVAALSKKHKWMGWPVVRGVVNFVSMLKIGYQTISKSSAMLGLEEEEPSRFEKWLAAKLGKSTEAVVMGAAMVVAMVLAVGLFFLLPAFVAQLLKRFIASAVAVNLVEGAVRMVIFIGYMLAVSVMKEIRRTFMYHGAEHKTIACFEAGEALTPQNARKYPRQHPRCGTAFLLIVMVVSILIFSVFGVNINMWTRLASRLLLLPVVAGVSYELLKWLGHCDNLLARALRAPGMWLQNLTTREPDEGMLEVAICAFNACTNGRYAVHADAEQPEPAREKTAQDADACAQSV